VISQETANSVLLLNTEVDPRPRANFSLNLHSPNDFGPESWRSFILGDWNVNYFFRWRDGGRFLSNPAELEIQKRIYVEMLTSGMQI
jgi:hypothetical protein